MADHAHTHEHRHTGGHHDDALASHRWRTAENSAAYLLPHLTPDAVVLDVGCGPATVTAGIAARVARVTGVDAAAAVLEEAAETVRAAGLDNVELTVGDALELPFPDDAFDVVHAHQVLHHVADPVRALSEMRRVCRPGGVVAAREMDVGGMIWFPRPAGMEAWLPIFGEVARADGGEPDAGRRLVSWARAAGLTGITATVTAWCFATPEERQWWNDSWGGQMVRPDFADVAVERGDATREQLAAIRDGWSEWAAAEDGWFAVPHGEILCRA